MSETITKLKDQIETFVAQGQEKMTQLEEQGKSNSEGLEKLMNDLGEKAETFQKMSAQIEAVEAEQKQLENLLARMPKADAAKGDIGDPDYRKGFSDYARKGGSDLLTPDQVEKALGDYASYYNLPTDNGTLSALKAGLVGSNPDGGFLAPIDPVRFITSRIFETSPVRQVANVISTGREAVSVIIDDEEAGDEWVGEVDARSITDTPQLAELEIPTHEQAARPRLSRKAIDDVTLNFESWLQGKVADRFSRGEATAFITGDGVKRPRGILDYPAWTTQGAYERFALEHRDTAADNALAADDLIDLQSDLLEGYQPAAQWMMHRKIWSEIVKLKDSVDGQYLINPQLLFTGTTMQLLGAPVRFAADMPSAVADGESVVIYGDFGQGYTIVDRIGIRVLRDPYTDKRFVEYYTTRRVGGAVTNYQAIKVLDIQ